MTTKKWTYVFHNRGSYRIALQSRFNNVKRKFWLQYSMSGLPRLIQRVIT